MESCLNMAVLQFMKSHACAQLLHYSSPFCRSFSIFSLPSCRVAPLVHSPHFPSASKRILSFPLIKSFVVPVPLRLTCPQSYSRATSTAPHLVRTPFRLRLYLSLPGWYPACYTALQLLRHPLEELTSSCTPTPTTGRVPEASISRLIHQRASALPGTEEQSLSSTQRIYLGSISCPCLLQYYSNSS